MLSFEVTIGPSTVMARFLLHAHANEFARGLARENPQTDIYVWCNNYVSKFSISRLYSTDGKEVEVSYDKLSD